MPTILKEKGAKWILYCQADHCEYWIAAVEVIIRSQAELLVAKLYRRSLASIHLDHASLCLFCALRDNSNSCLAALQWLKQPAPFERASPGRYTRGACLIALDTKRRCLPGRSRLSLDIHPEWQGLQLKWRRVDNLRYFVLMRFCCFQHRPYPV